MSRRTVAIGALIVVIAVVAAALISRKVTGTVFGIGAADHAKRKCIRVRALAYICSKLDFSVNVAWLRCWQTEIDWHESNFRNRQSSFCFTASELVSGGCGGPSGCKILGLPRVID